MSIYLKTGKVLPEWTDYNGHMNLAFYIHLFDSSWEVLLEKFNGEVPRSLEELQSLPGVGRKTANVVLNMAFDIPTVAVDTHVFRVSNRTKIAVGKNVNEVELALLKNIPKKYLYHAHHWLILHGRYICKARKPLCDKCPILDLCPFNL